MILLFTITISVVSALKGCSTPQIYIIPTLYILLIFVSVPILLLLDAACYVGRNRLGIK